VAAKPESQEFDLSSFQEFQNELAGYPTSCSRGFSLPALCSCLNDIDPLFRTLYETSYEILVYHVSTLNASLFHEDLLLHHWRVQNI